MLEVVEQHEQPLAADVIDEPVVRADPRRDRPLDQRRIAERLQRDAEDAVGELVDRVGRQLEREARLAAPAGPSQREQPMRADERTCLGELALSAHERGGLDRQVRAMERPERRKLAVAELVQDLRRTEVLEAMVAELAGTPESSSCRVDSETRT